MELEEKIKNIPEELYEDISILAEISFLRGETYFSDQIFPSDMKKFSDEIWDMLYDKSILLRFAEDRIRFWSLKLQIYLAIERLIKIKNYSIYNIEEILEEKWYENEELEEKQYEILHMIANFNQKKFNEEYLLDNLKYFLNNIDDNNKEKIALDILEQIFAKISLWNDLKSIGTIGPSTYVNDSLRYLGIDLYDVLEEIPFYNYEIIIKNKYFKESENGYDEYVIEVEKIKEDDYILEIFRETGAIDKLNDIYHNVAALCKDIENKMDEDYFKIFE